MQQGNPVPVILTYSETKTVLACLNTENSTQYKFKKYVFQILDREKIIPGTASWLLKPPADMQQYMENSWSTGEFN